MVMETPSPQCVGLEFVRQYYTVLNKAPMHLHRFYSNNSLFMHGGPNNVNDPTVGQADIHKKILSLNFQDCHAKIRMVDAHATLGSGVVIQVTGELSNNGNPMRRFMQTFVLAPQSAKKYYVHNDIFRYQDEVFSDEEVVEDGCIDPEEELESSSPGIVEGSYSSNSTTVNGTSSSHHNHTHHRDPEPPTSPIPPPAPPTAHIPQSPQVTPVPTSTPSVASPPQVSVTQTSTTTTTSATSTNSLPAEPRPSTPPAPEVDGWGGTTSGSDDWSVALEEEPSTPTPKKELTKSPSTQSEQSNSGVTQSVSLEPKTYANLFKNSSCSSHSPSQHPPQPPHNLQNEQSSSIAQPAYSSQIIRSESMSSRSSGPPSGPSPGAPQSQGPGGMGMRPRNFHDDEKRRSAVPDCQQVFVGNLPHNIGEEQLRGEFTRFGRILDVRINTGKGKTGVKGPGHPVPNFGFIAFDSEEAVLCCLNARPIYLNGDNRINVEEKKARNRMESNMGGGGRPSSGGGRGGMNNNSGMRSQGIMSGGGRGGGRGSFTRDNSRGGSGGPRGGSFMARR